MDLRRLDYFLKVCAAESLSDAANSAGISQPALSRQIRLLEEELGVSLFERHSRGMNLNELGLRFLPRVEALLREAECLKTDVAAEAVRPRGQLRIGTASLLRRFLVTPSIVRFLSRYPDVGFKIHEGTSRTVRDSLLAGTVDLAILSSLENLDPFRTRRVASEALFLIGPRKGYLSMAKPTRVAAIAELPLVLTARPNSMRLIVDRALHRHNLVVEPKIEVETLQMALDLIDTTSGYSVFPYSAIDLPLRESRITASPIEKLNISWTIATARDKHESAAIRLFADEMIAESRRKIQDSKWLSAVSNA